MASECAIDEILDVQFVSAVTVMYSILHKTDISSAFVTKYTRFNPFYSFVVALSLMFTTIEVNGWVEVWKTINCQMLKFKI